MKDIEKHRAECISKLENARDIFFAEIEKFPCEAEESLERFKSEMIIIKNEYKEAIK